MKGKPGKATSARDEAALAKLARTVVRHRNRQKRTQEDVAHSAEIALRTYQNLEVGRLNPGYLTLLRVAQGLEMRLGDLLNDVR